jgi:signal transduction histidine kinase
MIPQLLFSLLLFGSVAAAYIMIGRNLRKEKELAHLRNDFMSNMSHELKTPVSTISVALEALSNFNAADNENLRKEYIDISKTEVERLGLLVDKALNISLFEQGRFVYNKQSLDLNVAIKSVLRTLKVQLDNQQVDLNYNSEGSHFYLMADNTHMINVIHNLIENAIKYSTKTPQIKISLSESSDYLELRVSDKGRGIAPSFQDKIFDKFFRVPQGNTHNTKGHGLGLSYVKEVISNHGGEIKVKSALGEGTTFIIYLPKLVNA